LHNWEQEGIKLRQSSTNTYTSIAMTLKKKYKLDKTIDQIGERIRYLIKKEMIPSSSVSKTDKKTYSINDIKQYYSAVKSLNQAANKLDTKQTEATVDIDDNKPVLLIFWGDWHVGAKGVDYDQLDKDIALVSKTDGAYVFGLGDYKDNGNAFVIPSTAQENQIPPGMQDLIVQDMMNKLKGKIQVLVRGCHDDWDYKVANKDFIQTLCDNVNAVNLWHGGFVNVVLGNEEYKLYIRHKYKNESGLNTTNVQRNIINDRGHVDIAAVAHKHFPDLQMLKRQGKDVIYLRTGSYKQYDEFGQKIGGYSGAYGIPCVVIFPNTHKTIPFFDLQQGINYINYLRK